MRPGFFIKPSTASDTLVISLTSYGGHAQPAQQFEWINILALFECHQIFLIDSYQHWYHGGIVGFSHSLDQTIDRIREYANIHNISNIFTIGSSMGGHGALLFGALLNAKGVVSFAPQISMSADWLLSIEDRRWEWKTKEMNYIGYDYLDLADYYHRIGRPQETLVYYDSSVTLDAIHVQRLAGPEDVKLMDCRLGEHEIAYALAKSGEITRILADRVALINR